MTSVEHADESLVGLGPNAETRLPVEWVERRKRAGNVFVIGVLAAIQLVWIAGLLYAAYFFIF
jgi:hypothetical protein